MAAPKPRLPALPEPNLPEELAFTPVPRKTKRWNGITPTKQRIFIDNLAGCGCVKMAANSIGASDGALYQLRKAEGAESFAAAWDIAIEGGARRVLDLLMEHAIHGTPETLLKDGEVILERRKYNTRAMMWIVAQRFPEQYGSATGLMDMNGMSGAMKKLKAKWEKEFKEKYDADLSAEALAKAEADEREREEQRRELLPPVLVRIYQNKVREERSYRLCGQTTHADMTLRQLTHIELYMEFAGLVEPEILAFFDSAQRDPHPWETEAGRAIIAHREAAWAMDLPATEINLEDKNTVSAEPVEPEAQPETTGGQLREALAQPLLRPTPLQYGPSGPMHSALHGGETTSQRSHARRQAEAQMAEAQRLWEACATEESWAARKE